MEIRGLIQNAQRIQCLFIWALLVCIFTTAMSQDEQLASTPGLPTVTVRGFLNFKTTVDGTVIVFTPASEVHQPSTQPKIVSTSSEVPDTSESPTKSFIPNEDLTSEKEMHEAVQDLAYASPPQNSLESIKTQIPNLNLLENKMKETFLQHISDNAVLPSTRQVNNDLDKVKKLSSSQNQYPTGLVTVLGGTFIDGTSTTVFETKVIGTYIDGKYAQILQSTSSVVADPTTFMTATPTMTYLTVDRSHSKAEEQISSSFSQVSAPSSSIISVQSSPSLFSKSLVANTPSETFSIISPTVTSSEISKSVTSEQKLKPPSKTKEMLSSTIAKNENTASTFPSQYKSRQNTLESSFVTTSVTVTFDNEQPTESLESAIGSTLTKTKSKFIPITSTVARFSDDDNTLPTTQKTPRNSTSRTRFHSPRRPSQSVRLNRFKVKLTLRHDSSDEYNVTVPADDEDLEEDHTHKSDDEAEVVTESIGIEVDPAKVVFQETTITSEVTIHVGRRKSVRTLTITTSVPLTVNPTDIQDILAAESTSMEREASEVDFNHHIVTRTFTTTERALKTSVVPVYDGKSTAYHTVTESFFIMKIITAYRTLPLGDASVLESAFEESDTPETTLEAAANIQPSVIQSAPPEQFSTENTVQPSMIVPSSGNAPPQLSNPFLSLGNALNNPLAAVYLGLQQLNAQMTLYSTVTDTSTYVTTETLYSTKTIRFYDGRSTRYRTVSDPTATKKRTVTTTMTSVQPYLNTHAIQQQQQLQKLIGATRMAPPEPEYSTITSIYTTVTTTTSLSPRIYTLIYNGFSTKFRTVTSTTMYPTTVTITSTTKVPIAPTNVPFSYPYSL
ncbi:unnamed protein product [Larinioides sclopetarius]|uniref:DUF4758 domain-containing protein n=1 Tax=Larinioides sclopetarius TaxID=280406 RepID=A0AAV1ZDC0_9ARAC